MDAPPVQYVTTPDGFNIACSITGSGRPIVVLPEPISHIQIYWTANTYMRPWLEALSRQFRLVLYDGRGQGMSSHGLSSDHSLADELLDLEAVIDHFGLVKFVLLARSTLAVLYALKHPQRVEALVFSAAMAFWHSQSSGWAEDLAAQNWALFLQTLAGLTSPSDPESLDRLRQSTNQQDWLARNRAAILPEPAELLSRLNVPVLVMHPRDYPVLDLEESRRLAAAIPGARLVVIDGATSRGEPEQGLRTIDAFLKELETRKVQEPDAPQGNTLSPRELDVLRLIVGGRSNAQIAEALVISPNTVGRHVSNIFDKTGVANRAEATAYAVRNGLA
jgi:pimeloyl-ACP methyl ester carboxylesterase/DNA-binding CsgD family transcriptional regulator